MRQEEARKMGLVIQFEPSEEEVEEMMNQNQHLASSWFIYLRFRSYRDVSVQIAMSKL